MGRKRKMGRGMDPDDFGPIIGLIGCAVTGVALITLLAAIDDEEAQDAQYAGVCVDRATEQRVDDSRCGDWDGEGVFDSGGTFMMWFPMNYGGDVPGVGQRAYGGTARVPSGAPVAKGVPATGATKAAGGMAGVQRGGFGAKAGTSGGSGAKAGSSAGS
jgi:hypothetical protein